MNTRILQIFGEIAGIGGLALGVVLTVFRDIIRKNVFPTLTKSHAYHLLRLIAILAWLAAIAGLLAWVYVARIEKTPTPGPQGAATSSNKPIDSAQTPQESGQLFRVFYFSVGGHALDFLTRGELDKKWETSLGGQPYIVPTASFALLKALVSRFTVPFNRVFFTADADLGNPDEALASRYSGQQFFIGGWRILYFDDHVDDSDVRELLDPSSTWNIQLTNRPFVSSTPVFFGRQKLPSDPGAMYFWRFARPADLDRLVDPRAPNDDARMRFYKFITKDTFPSDFGVVSFQYSACGDSAMLGLTTRYPRLLAVLIENVSREPIRIGRFTERQVSVDGLRSLSEDEERMKSVSPDTQSLFPPGLLAPGEKLLIPLRVSMLYDDRDFLFLPGLETSQPPLPNDIPGRVEVPVDVGYKDEHLIEMTRESIAQYYQKARPQIDPTREYIFGPSLEVNSVEINGNTVPIRVFNPKTLIIKSGNYSGSCPYVFTYSERAKRWLSQGHILFGVNGKVREKTDTTILQNFNGQLRVRESDPETSFIDSMRVDVTCSGSKAFTLLPKNDLLKSNDGKYLRLMQGDDVLVEFQGRVPSGCTSTLRTTGYYQPY